MDKPLPAATCKAQALQQLLDSQPLIDHAPRHASLRAQRLPPWRSRWAALDAALPDAGWPASGLIELLQDAPVHAEWHLLGRALGERLRNGSGPLVLIGDNGLQPFAPANPARPHGPGAPPAARRTGHLPRTASREWTRAPSSRSGQQRSRPAAPGNKWR